MLHIKSHYYGSHDTINVLVNLGNGGFAVIDAAYVLVLATPTSRPQRVYTEPSATRLAWLPGTFVIATWRQPLRPTW